MMVNFHIDQVKQTLAAISAKANSRSDVKRSGRSQNSKLLKGLST